MGQKVGKAVFDERAKPFVNLPGESIRALWQEFNLCANGWGVEPAFFEQLCGAVARSMGVEPDEKASKAFFSALDTDENNLVDGLELISTLGMLSAMTREEKVDFVFACYDVGGRSRLSMSELFLLLKSTTAGLCKLSGTDAPDSARFESVASLVFMHNESGMKGGLELDTLLSYCETNPVAYSWLAFYDDCEGKERDSGEDGAISSAATLEAAAPDIHHEEALFVPRSEAQEKANAGTDEGGAAVRPTGAWVEAAKDLVPPPPPPEEVDEAGEDANDEDEDSPATAGKDAADLTPPPPPPAPPAPDTQLSLEWVYGYSAASSRASVCYTASGATPDGVGVVYPAGKVAVVLAQPVDEEGAETEGDRVQSFMQEHTDDITALAVTPCGKWVATGETGANPKIVVWNAATKQIRNTVTGFHTVGICGLSWSPCGNFLASIGADEFHSLQIMEAVSAQPIFRVRTGASRPLGMAWTANGSSLVTCGQTDKNSPPLVFWVKEASTGSFAKKRGIAGAGKLAPSKDIHLAVCAAPGKATGGVKSNTTQPPCMVSGTAGGALCLWRGRNCCTVVADAHIGAVEVLSAGTARGGVVVSGGRDAKVKLWAGADLSLLATLDVMATPSIACLRQVRSVCLSADGTKVLVGTLGSDILELAAVEKPKNADGEDEGEEEEALAEDAAEEEQEGGAPRAKPSGIGRVLNGGRPLACGHCKGEAKGVDGELRSVDVSPQGDQFVTVGDDGTVRVWSNGEKKTLKTFNIGCPALSVCYSPDASLIAVGLSGGGVSVLKPSEEDLSTLVLEKDLDAFRGAGTDTTCVRFSPSGATLSAAAGNGSLKAWGTGEREWEEAGSADNVVSGSVVSMDFTADGMFVMLNSSDMDMAIANAETCNKASPKEMKALRGEGEDAEVATWATSTCTMANGKQAAWATMASGGGDTSSLSQPSTSAKDTNILTGSDLVKGGDAPILLASDALGRVGLLRYPAQLPDPPASPPAPKDAADGTEGAAAVPTPSSEETDAAAAAAAAAAAVILAEATEAAIPRVSIVKVHAGKVAAARQLEEGGGVVTLGATDRCVYQWAVSLEDGEESGDDLPDPPACNAPAPKTPAGGEEGAEEEEDNDEEGEEGGVLAEAWSGDDEDLVESTVKPATGFGNKGSQDLSEFLAQRALAESGSPAAVLPWLDGPGGEASSAPCVPDDDLKLEWIHGYSAQASRQNLVYNRNGEIVYPAACAGVVLTKCTLPQKHRQRYNLDHTQAITCLAMHPDKAHVATGQGGPSPFVVVWNSACDATKTKARLELGEDKKGVSQVCFSADGNLLAVACEDKGHTVMVFRWKEGSLRCQARLGVKKALSLCFSLNTNELVAAGHKHFKVWTLSGGGLMQGKRGLFGSGSKVQALTCAAAISNGEGGSSFVLGGSSGNLLKLEGRKVSGETEAHEGPVYAMYAYPSPDGSGTCLITGGGDGKIKTWDSELGMVNEFDLVGRPYVCGATPRVRSVCLNDHSDGRKILVGTSCSEILEISASDGADVNGEDCLIRGHFRDQLWGLAAHPAKAVYSSSGDEGMLKEWDATALALKREIDLGGWVRTVRYSPNGLLIACGMGGDAQASFPCEGASKRHSPREEDGTIKIVSGMEDAFRVVNTLKDALKPISCIRFSPDGNRMAAASLDGSIYIYSVLENFKLECMGEGGQGGIVRIDFSADGKRVRAEALGAGATSLADSTTIATILFSAESGDVCEDQNGANGGKGFATWSGLRGDHVAGVWPPDATSPLDVTSCCRSIEGSLLATSDERGDVKLFRYPATGRAASFKSFKAHALGVRSVCFLDKGSRSEHVVSVGGKDRCVMQWKIVHPEEPTGITMAKVSEGAHAEEDAWVQAELSALADRREASASWPRPWESGPGLAGAAPVPDESALTGIKLGLEFAHGYNSSGQARNNLGFSSSDKVILPCGSVGVVYDKVSHSQVLFAGHCGRVVSLAVSPCGRFVATGQEGRTASAIVWDPATGQQTCVLPTSLFGAVRRLSFSPDGQSLCGIGADRDSSLCVWTSSSGNWTDGARVALGQGPRRAALFVAWTSGNDCSPYQVMTGGQNYVIFWTLRPNLTSRLGKKGKSDDTKNATVGGGGSERAPETKSDEAALTSSSCLATSVEKAMDETFLCGVSIGKEDFSVGNYSSSCVSSGVTVTGTAKGAFVVWENFECVRMVPGAHGASAVLCLSPTYSGGFVSGGADGVVRVWDDKLNSKGTPINMNQAASACADAIRAVAVNRKESNMVVGTTSGRVVEISLDSGDTSVLVEGPAAALPTPTHGSGGGGGGGTAPGSNKSFAVAAHPKDENVFVTAAGDGFLRKWSVEGRRLIAKLAVGEGAVVATQGGAAEGVSTAVLPGIGAVDWASGGSFVACGLSSGDIVIVSPTDMVVLSRCPSDKKPKAAVTAVVVSLDETKLTVGCEDGSLHGMKLSQGGMSVQHVWSNTAGVAKGAPVLAMDLSVDGQAMRYCDGSSTISYITSAGVAMDAAPSGDDASTWSSSKCFVGHWGVRAASNCGSGVEATASARSHQKDLLAACDDHGCVGLWRYPASQEGAACVGGDARVPTPAALTFTADGASLIVVGGNDGSVLQWSVSRS